jgi:cellulose synthase/poly-beta-1,6-N-acetylglucosamine synthase-like glycosyltransferase
VVVAARNEAGGIEAAVRSMLALDYPALEVIVVDDRSEDDTGVILDRLADADPRLRVLHLAELPDGWLGKNHALHVGAAAARGELLLFTDADVVFEPGVLGRAASWMLAHNVDHLAGATDVRARTLWIRVFVATFALYFNAHYRPWRATSASKHWYAGFGGFNLVRREVYERAGTHEALRMDPLDDVHLGKIVKESGARQQCAVVGRLAGVEWYRDLPQAIRGLEKNTMAAANWSPAYLAAGAAAQLVATAWPFVALGVTGGLLFWLNAAIVLLLVVTLATMLRETSLPGWTALLLPIGAALIVYTFLRAAVLTYRRGGIEWRGTFYRLGSAGLGSRSDRSTSQDET